MCNLGRIDCKTCNGYRPLVAGCTIPACDKQLRLWMLVCITGGLITTFTRRSEATPTGNESHNVVESSRQARTIGLLLIAVWAIVLIGASVGVSLIPYEDAKPLHWFEGFYRTGSFIFGGGQVC